MGKHLYLIIFRSFVLSAVALMLCMDRVFAQNLVPNHSFENIGNCPTILDQLNFTKNWYGLGTADPSPDLFNSCAEAGTMGVPANFFGNQEAKTGDGYAGLICYLTSKSGKSWKLKDNHREYLMTKLLEPLQQGKRYRVAFSVSLAEFCEFSVDQIGLMLTDKIPPIDPTYIDFNYFKPQVKNHPDSLLSHTNRWITVEDTIVAEGGEQIITLGTFIPDKMLNPKKNGDGQNIFYETMEVPKRERPQIAYYFVDDIIVSTVDKQPMLSEAVTKTLEPATQLESPYFGYLQEGDKVVLNNIYFEFDKSVLLPESYAELEELLNFLNIYSEYKIKITGHTDNKGSDDYNLKLSLERAIAVARYLYQKGIPLARLEYEGMGSKDPIASNDTEIGQAKNRRVEFEIIGKY